MEAIITVLMDVLIFILGFSGSLGVFWFYNHLPLSWFRDYGVAEGENGGPDPRMKRFPDGVWFCTILPFILFLFYLRYDISLAFVCSVFSIYIFACVFAADKKTQIIPDQFIVSLLFVSLLWMVNDMYYIQESGEAWYWGILMRTAGGVIGGGVLWIISFIGSRVLKQEAMGMGDVKLAFACGGIAGASGIFWVLVLSFLFAFFPALFHMLGKRQVRGRIPFAPFLVIATALYILFPSEFALFSYWYSHFAF